MFHVLRVDSVAELQAKVDAYNLALSECDRLKAMKIPSDVALARGISHAMASTGVLPEPIRAWTELGCIATRNGETIIGDSADDPSWIAMVRCVRGVVREVLLT